MGKGKGSLRRTKIGAFVAVLVLALSVPGIAFAANTATFRSVTPVKGSSSTVVRPLVAATVYDKYGVTKMPSMKLDGTYVARSLVRIGSGLNKFRLSYQVASDLSLGSHSVTIRVKDRRGRISKTTWTFTVVAPGGSGSITQQHALPVQVCTSSGCHGTVLALGTQMTSDLPSIHRGRCYMCHAVGATASNNCMSTACHGVNGPHGEHVAFTSTSDPACTTSTCHGTAAMTIHDSCATCHSSTDPTVVAAIAADATTCESCHTGTQAVIHAGAAAQHTVSGSCFISSGCHSPDVSVIHSTWARNPGCAACHAPGVTPSLTCANCHDNIHVFTHAAAAGTKSSACVSCHGSDLPTVHAGETDGCFCHTNTDGNMNATMKPLMLAGAAECVDCHVEMDAAHGFNMNVSGHNTTTYGTVGAFEKFDGSAGNPLLLWESEIASSSLNATWAVEGDPRFVAVAPTGLTSVAVGQEGTVTTNWDFPTVNVFWESDDTDAPTDALFLDEDDVVTCQDCHAGLNAAGPHGAADNWALDADYPGDYSYAELTKWVATNPAGVKMRSTLETMPAAPSATATNVVTGNLATFFQGSEGDHAVICTKCHDLQNVYSGTTALSVALPWMVPGSAVATATNTGVPNIAAVGSSNTAHSSHHQDAADGSAQCVNCHIGVPHGWKAPRLLVNTGTPGASAHGPSAIAGDEAPYLDPQHLGTTRVNDGAVLYSYDVETGTWVAGAAVSGQGYNRIGMLSLSAVDNHTLTAGGSVTTPTTGAAQWNEPSCQACNDHEGEDGFRIITSGPAE